MNIFVFVLIFFYGCEQIIAMQHGSVSSRELDTIKTVVVCCIKFGHAVENQVVRYKQNFDVCQQYIDRMNNSGCCFLCSCFQDKSEQKN